MHTSQASLLLDDYPLAAKYASDAVVITGEMPSGFGGTVDDIAATGKETTALTSAVDAFIAETPSNKLVMLSYNQGHWLRYNHPNFIRAKVKNN